MKKYNLAIIIITAIILEVSVAIQFYISHAVINEQILEKANGDLKEVERIATVRSEVESAVRNTLTEVQKNLGDPDKYYNLMYRVVKINPHIIGAGVAFVPYHFKRMGKDKLFSRYAYKQNHGQALTMATSNIKATSLSFDYTEREWYKHPTRSDSCYWTQAYMDESGLNVLMYTYAIPIKNLAGRTVGVFFADVPMKTLTFMAKDMHSGINKGSFFLILLQIFGALAIMLIMWRAIVAFRHQKEITVDPEKEQMAEQINKLKEVNRRLTDRNMKLANQVQEKEQQKSDVWY